MTKRTRVWAARLVCALLGFGSLLSSVVQAGEGLQRIKQRGTLIWGADQEGGGPFVFPDDADPTRVQGFEVELAALIAEQLGVQAKFQQGQWDKLPDLVDRGDIDIVLNGYEWTPNRASRYGVSIPYYIYELQLLGRVSDSTLTSWDDLIGPNAPKRRVCCLGGSAAHDYLMQHGQDRIEVVQFDGATDAMRATELNLDGIDANLQDLPVWTFFESGFPELHPVGPPVGRGYYVALVRQNEPELLDAINAALLQVMKDGRLHRILAKYRIWNPTQAQRGLEIGANGNFVGDGGKSQSEGPEEEESTYIASSGWTVLQQRGGLLIHAAGMTVLLSVVAMPLAIAIGLSMTLLRLYGPRSLSMLATMYVELVRGTPLVLQLYVIFFLLPEIGLSISAFWAAVAGLAINYSAYEAEIYRAGLLAIPKGQMEAALSLGMTRNMALRRVLIPQATRLVIPPVTNDFIALFKDTAVCSVITVVELSKEYYIQARSTGAIVELGLLTALLYLAMSYPLSLVASRLEKRLNQERQA